MTRQRELTPREARTVAGLAVALKTAREPGLDPLLTCRLLVHELEVALVYLEARGEALGIAVAEALLDDARERLAELARTGGDDAVLGRVWIAPDRVLH